MNKQDQIKNIENAIQTLQEQLDELKNQPDEPEPWRPKSGEKYYRPYITGDPYITGNVKAESWDDHLADNKWTAAPLGITKTLEEMEARIQYHTIIRELEELADGGDWGFEIELEKIKIIAHIKKSALTPQFSSQKRAQAAIKRIGEDRLRWAFNYAAKGGRVDD